MKYIPYQKYTQEQRLKWGFAVKELFDLVKAIEKAYTYVIYSVTEDGEEKIDCGYKNENIRINVTGDSLTAMTIDVLKKLFY